VFCSLASSIAVRAAARGGRMLSVAGTGCRRLRWTRSMTSSQWVETGTATEKLIATKYQGDDPTKPIVMQRPACPIRRQHAMRLGRYERGGEILLRMAGAVLVSVRRSCRRRP
jgi:hypothetical protein